MLRLGVVGPGLIWQGRHQPALDKLKNIFEVKAFLAFSERNKEKVSKDFPQASFDTNSKIFMDRPEIDAVMVLTPIHLNASVALQALNAGKDVFLEKPMAHDLQAAKG